jgi:hypothetical protein
VTIAQRQRFNLLAEQLTALQNECNRAQTALTLASEEEDNGKVDELLNTADEALN